METSQKTNWRERVKPEWLYINLDAVARGLVEKGTPIEDVEDRFLCIKLAGLRALALERGYSMVDYEIVSASADYVAMKCEIGWDEFPGGRISLRWGTIMNSYYRRLNLPPYSNGTTQQVRVISSAWKIFLNTWLAQNGLFHGADGTENRQLTTSRA